MSKNIEPKRERVREIAKILMDNVHIRLKRFNLYDCHDPNDQRHYQPFDVASVVAIAECDMKRGVNSIEDHKTARDDFDNEKSRLQRKRKKIEKITNQNFDDLAPDVRLSSFYGNKEVTGPYLEALVKKDRAKDKKERLIKSKTRPKEKHLDKFCENMKEIFLDRGHKSLNYKFIADIANLFNLSNSDQSYDSIRKRFHRLSK